MGAEEKPVVELGSFSILNPKPPGKAVVDGEFSVDNGNAATGAKLFKAKCASCHTIKEGGPNMQGPNLYGIMGQMAGKRAGQKYTKGMKTSGVVWDNETMFNWLTNPKSVIKGTNMAFVGFKKPADSADVIAFLNKNK
mmetsp:Transcript_14143/g.28659  ORF Transcript_14143/g.28659 Transcript_14143/m.28659 type:complete len:138 (-) Transcript_14143:45-458(-)|eukprot:CAMPEP_0119070016 /NCGR_PEP_ID=MMETSP1178-20130426/33355_1 /TAXON_ID=33656 /ORGANISM="unid sp, Strain CCMP2000" /LENGTH=137 /DNA_ID=CAMNT_0007051825 /DNA_START=47 /DNA_END=460 /DNA_ORIENTATION=+